MSNIHVRQAHTLGRDGALEKLREFEDFLAKYKVSLAWKGTAAAVKGIGVSGNVDILDDAVDVKVKLGMLARAGGIDAKRLESSISRRLASALED